MTRPAADAFQVLIVGGGYTGAALAYHLAQRRDPHMVITVVEQRSALGGGLAYSSRDPSHRINVPARRMSLGSDDPGGFARWLGETGAAGDDPDAEALGGELFPRRAVFGRYIAEALAPFIDSGTIRHERATAIAAEPNGEGFVLRLHNGARLPADALVLATTHPLPSVPAPLRPVADHPGFHADPYDTDRLGTIGPDESVLVVGTGLTMADTVASLDRRGHHGRILALSRHGWRSRGHPAEPVEASGDFTSDPARSVTALFARVRTELAQAAAKGLPWQSVFGALRQQGPAIWAALSEPQRARLVRHARTLWDVHRFRIAPQVEAVLDRRIAEGGLAIEAASLQASHMDGAKIAVTVRPRHQTDSLTLSFDRVVLTTGPGHGGIARTNSLLASLVASGDLRADSLGLGLDTSLASRAIGRGGREGARLFVAGPLSRATFGELMGLPEVTQSAERVAEGVADLVERTARAHGHSQTPLRVDAST